MTNDQPFHVTAPLEDLSIANEEIALFEAANSVLKLALRLRQEAFDHFERRTIVNDWIHRCNLPFHWKRADHEEPLEFFSRLLQEIQRPKPNASHERSWRMLEDALHEVIKAYTAALRFAEAVQFRSEKAVYDFAYGLTHEINNPLANIAARAQQQLAKASDPSDQKSLATIVDQAMRAHEMLAEMMQAVKPTKMESKTVLVSEIAQRAVEICRNLVESRQVTFSTRVSSSSLYVFADPELFGDAIADVIRNALDACQAGDRIELSIQAIALPLEDVPKESWNDDQEKRNLVQICIIDTGHGMCPDSMLRANNLYFSGREHGRGLGISLAKVHRVVRAVGGSIAFRSEPETGTTVEIQIPRAYPANAKPRQSIQL